MLPSGEVLLGIKVQQKVPRILHTPSFSASSISKAVLFYHAIREVGQEIVQQCLVDVTYPINILIYFCPPEKKRLKT